MKKQVLASVLGTASLLVLTASSYGQGSVFFDNYDVTPYYPVTYSGSGNLAGSDVSVELGYALGANQTTGFTLLPTSITALNAATPGYFEGPIVTIPDYVSGPVTFEILGWTTTGGTTFANAAFNTIGSPYTWTEASIPANPSPAGSFAALPGNINLTPTTVVPEPTTLALAGLGGLASLMAMRRKKA
jgi:hypothetical protein